MSDSLTTLLTQLLALWCGIALWGASIAFIYWDSQRRHLPNRQRLRWLLVGLLPFIGFIAYLAAGRRAGPELERHTLLLHTRPDDEPDPPTIPSAYWQPEPVQQWTLAVTAGPHAGQQITLDTFPAQIGRRSDCAVCLPDDAAVSRQHAEFYRQDGRLYLRDLGSTHGTSVNGQPVRQTAVRAGDRIEVGQSVLVVA